MDTNADEPSWVHNTQGERSASVIQIDSSKHVAAIAICAVISGICLSVSIWSVMRFTELEQRYTAEAAKTATEYRVVLNHYMELEAQVKEMR